MGLKDRSWSIYVAIDRLGGRGQGRRSRFYSVFPGEERGEEIGVGAWDNEDESAVPWGQQ